MKLLSQYLCGLFLGLGLVLSAVPCHAQDSHRVNVTIPFDFVVGDKQLKAGDYVVESLLDGRALRFRGKGGDVQQIAFTVPITNQTGNANAFYFIITVTSISHRRSGSGETKMAAKSLVELKRRVLGKAGQPMIK